MESVDASVQIYWVHTRAFTMVDHVQLPTDKYYHKLMDEFMRINTDNYKKTIIGEQPIHILKHTIT